MLLVNEELHESVLSGIKSRSVQSCRDSRVVSASREDSARKNTVGPGSSLAVSQPFLLVSKCRNIYTRISRERAAAINKPMISTNSGESRLRNSRIYEFPRQKQTRIAVLFISEFLQRDSRPIKDRDFSTNISSNIRRTRSPRGTGEYRTSPNN